MGEISMLLTHELIAEEKDAEMATANVELSQKALVFDIERFSTKDGPGIRTVVFSRVATCGATSAIILRASIRKLL